MNLSIHEVKIWSHTELGEIARLALKLRRSKAAHGRLAACAERILGIVHEGQAETLRAVAQDIDTGERKPDTYFADQIRSGKQILVSDSEHHIDLRRTRPPKYSEPECIRRLESELEDARKQNVLLRLENLWLRADTAPYNWDRDGMPWGFSEN